ncbi:MAG: hypothetical protein SFW35_07935 [Chitinophagales bacterium]|nr:hypothetical protein [Chitinophagales bacterium]
MRYLAELTKSLTAEEYGQINSLEIKGKAKLLLEWTWQNRHQPYVQEVDRARQEIGVTEGTLFKLNSILCNQICECLVPEGGLHLIKWLLKKVLMANLFHEMKLMEKKIGNLPKADKIEFYAVCFEAAQRVPLKFIDEKLVRYYAKKLRQVSQNPETDLYTEAMMLATFLYCQSAGILPDKIKNPLAQLQKIERNIYSSSLPCLRAHYYLNRAYSLYYNDVEFEPEISLEWLKKSLRLFEYPEHPFNDDEVFVSRCRIAEALYALSEYSEAQAMYGEIFKSYPPDSLVLQEHYHHTKFIQLSLITGRYEAAYAVLSTKMKRVIDSKHTTLLTLAAISYAKYHILLKEGDKALEYVQLAQGFNKKDLYVQYEVELRNLQIAAFALAGDEEFVLTLSRKNLRYLRSKGLGLENSNYGFFYQMVAAFVRKTELNTTLSEKYKDYHRGYYAVYGRILFTIAQHYQVAVPEINIR